MKKRILTAVIGIAILLPILFLSGTWFFPVAVAVCCDIALFEMLRCLGLARVWALSLPTYALAAVVPFLIRLSDRGTSLTLAAMLAVCAVLYLMGVSVFTHGKITFAQLGEALLACLYIIFGFNAIVYLRDLVGQKCLLRLYYNVALAVADHRNALFKALCNNKALYL